MSNKVVTFFEKVGGELKKLFLSSTTEQQIQADITYAAPIVETILTFVDPAVEPLVAGAVSIAKADLATISATAQSAKVTPGSTAAQTITAAANSINSNLSGLLDVAEVKNSTKSAEITAAVNTITQEMNALVAALAPVPAAA